MSYERNNTQVCGVGDCRKSISEFRRLSSSVSSETLHEAREKAFSSQYSKWGIAEIWDKIYYDDQKKVFFSVIVDGNFYHGYDVHYFVESKENVLQAVAHDMYLLMRIHHLDELPKTAASFVIADSLEVDPDVKEYKPPVEIGKGEFYI